MKIKEECIYDSKEVKDNQYRLDDYMRLQMTDNSRSTDINFSTNLIITSEFNLEEEEIALFQKAILECTASIILSRRNTLKVCSRYQNTCTHHNGECFNNFGIRKTERK